VNAPKRWLIVAGPLSGYTFDLFREVRRLAAVDVGIVHDPLVSEGQFAHQRFSDPDFESLEWRRASTADLSKFITRPLPAAVFAYGLEPKKALALARTLLPRDVPFLYAADSNVAELVAHDGLLAPRLIGYRLLAARIDVGLSLGLSNQLALRLLGMQRVEPIPVYAVDYDALDRAASEGGGVTLADGPEPRLTLLVVARLVAAKNLVPTFEALGSDARLRSQIRVVVVGDGPLRGEVEAAIRRHPGLDVQLLGAIPHARVGALIATADALLLPSVVEPWGIVVTEALGMGVPVVATPAVGAAVSLAGMTQAVVLSDSCDGESIVAALRVFVQRHAALRTAAHAAKAQVRQRYSKQAVARALIELVANLGTKVATGNEQVSFR